MSVFKSAFTSQVQDLIETDSASRTLTVQLGRANQSDEIVYARLREEIARLTEVGELREIIFDLSDVLVLPSSALGLIAAVSQGEVAVRVINASPAAREDFLMTKLYRIIEVEPALHPPAK